ncbi:MAG: VIT1/CCC1 transporter family protein [Candidatus Paceibacterota bacterium]
MKKYIKTNKDYLHHQRSPMTDVFREIFFGIEDGMVSTLGSITGIAIGSNNHATVILAGIVIVSVESISMGIGSYLSNHSQEEVEKREKEEEKEGLEKFPKEEKEELYQMYLDTGWSENLARQMSEEASKNKKLILEEMITHELKIPDGKKSISIKGGFYMFFAYILGGFIPLFSYLILPLKNAIPFSIGITLIGILTLGIITAKFTKQPVIKSSLKVLFIGGTALAAGLIAGVLIR